MVTVGCMLTGAMRQLVRTCRSFVSVQMLRSDKLMGAGLVV